MAGPEGDIPSALSNPVPEFSLRFHLDWRDALAWQMLPAEQRGLQRWVYIGFLVAGGMAYGILGEHLPAWVTRFPYIVQMLAMVASMHGLWMVYFNLLQRHRARKRLPRRVYCVFEDWGDYIYFCEGPQDMSLSVELCRQTVVTPHHLFLDFGDPLVIIPTTAFASPAEQSAFGKKWQRLGDEAVD